MPFNEVDLHPLEVVAVKRETGQIFPSRAPGKIVIDNMRDYACGITLTASSLYGNCFCGEDDCVRIILWGLGSWVFGAGTVR